MIPHQDIFAFVYGGLEDAKGTPSEVLMVKLVI